MPTLEDLAFSDIPPLTQDVVPEVVFVFFSQGFPLQNLTWIQVVFVVQVGRVQVAVGA